MSLLGAAADAGGLRPRQWLGVAGVVRAALPARSPA